MGYRSRISANALLSCFGLHFLAFGVSAQTIEVELQRRTALDDRGVHVEPLTKVPPEEIELPPVDTTGGVYLNIFYSWEIEGDEKVTVLVMSGDQGETLYVDINNDEDLSNDGDPIFFPYDQNELVFFLHPDSLPEQRTGRFLHRIPQYELEDTTASNFVDDVGNLKRSFINYLQVRQPGFEGKKGTYYFDGYVDLSRGHVEIEGERYAIGVHDYNQNGRFDDVVSARDPRSSDRLMIDLGKDGVLSSMSTTEIFKLDDVFKVGELRYKLAHIDPYGERITLVETDEPTTNYYVQDFEAKQEEYGLTQKGRLGEEIWDLILVPIDGSPIPLGSLKGRAILLNFWGEWCAPCIAEIPAIVQSREKWSEDELTIVGMLNTFNLEAAEALIEEHTMTWPHVRTSDNLVEQFKVNSYPTNILILPDGETFVKTGQMSTAFIDNHLK